MSRIAFAVAVLVTGLALDGTASAETAVPAPPSHREHRLTSFLPSLTPDDGPRKFEVVTTLPTFTPAAPSLPSYDPRLLVRQLGLDARTFWLTPQLELSFVQGTRLVTLDVIGWGQVQVTPTGFGGGTVTLSTAF
jgi:hypothetical protein